MAAPDSSQRPSIAEAEGSFGKAATAKQETVETAGLGKTDESREMKKTAGISKKEKRFPIKAIVKRDDTLFTMTVRAYGFSNERVLNFVKQNNPSIKDISQIEAGSTIIFPPLDESLKESSKR